MTTPELTEDAFFAALLETDTPRLDEVLADDFLIVDVTNGSAVKRDAFVAAVRNQLVTFTGIDVYERTTRHYPYAAIIVGRTAMRGQFADAPFSLSSRYTHVFIRDADDRWLLASAQGTPITPSP
jgi:ketosteroid isomerase-like protein